MDSRLFDDSKIDFFDIKHPEAMSTFRIYDFQITKLTEAKKLRLKGLDLHSSMTNLKIETWTWELSRRFLYRSMKKNITKLQVSSHAMSFGNHREILKILMLAKKIKELSLIFLSSLSPGIYKSIIKKILTAIQFTKTLQHMKLTLPIYSQELSRLQQIFKTLIDLKTLQLELKLAKEIHSEEICPLFFQLKGLRNCNKFQFLMSRNNSIKESWERTFNSIESINFCSIFPNMTQLNSLTISFPQFYLLKDSDYILFFDGLSILQNLQSLTLMVQKTILNRYHDDYFSGLGEFLRKSKIIKYLNLKFCDVCCSRPRPILKLLSSFRKIPQLTHFLFFFDQTQSIPKNEFGEEEINFFSNGVRSLTTLKILSLELKSIQFMNRAIFIHVCEALSELENLQNFSLVIVDCDIISDELLSTLGESIIKLKWISILKLHIRASYVINPLGTKAIDSFLDSIGSISQIETLDLSFQHLREKNYKTLGRNLAMIFCLKYLKLDLSGSFITNDAFYDLVSQFPQLEGVENLTLNFIGCEKLEDNGVIDLSPFLSEMTNLRELKMNFSERTTKILQNRRGIENSMFLDDEVEGEFVDDRFYPENDWVIENLLDSTKRLPHLKTVQIVNYTKVFNFS